jgi:hypothetical protein
MPGGADDDEYQDMLEVRLSVSLDRMSFAWCVHT